MQPYRRNCKKEKLVFAKRMRKNPTAAELAFWMAYKRYPNRDRVIIRRQSILLGFIVDFWVPSRRLVIELDGSIHDRQREYDQQRTQILESRISGLKVIRFPNGAVLDNPAEVMRVVQRRLLQLPVYASWSAKSPVEGDGESPVTPDAQDRQRIAQRQPIR